MSVAPAFAPNLSGRGTPCARCAPPIARSARLVARERRRSERLAAETCSARCRAGRAVRPSHGAGSVCGAAFSLAALNRTATARLAECGLTRAAPVASCARWYRRASHAARRALAGTRPSRCAPRSQPQVSAAQLRALSAPLQRELRSYCDTRARPRRALSRRNMASQPVEATLRPQVRRRAPACALSRAAAARAHNVHAPDAHLARCCASYGPGGAGFGGFQAFKRAYLRHCVVEGAAAARERHREDASSGASAVACLKALRRAAALVQGSRKHAARTW